MTDITLHQILKGEKVVGFKGRGAGLLVGAKQFAVVADSNDAIAYLTEQWLRFPVDQSQIRNAVFLRRTHYDHLVNERRELLEIIDDLIEEVRRPGFLAQEHATDIDAVAARVSKIREE